MCSPRSRKRPASGEALGELGVDELVDHDPGRDDPPREGVADTGGHDHEAADPGPHRDRADELDRACPGRRRRRASRQVRPRAASPRERPRRRRPCPPRLAAEATSCRTRSSTTGAAGVGLQHGGVGLGDAIDPVLPLDQLSRAFAHRRTNSRVGKGLERGEQCVLLVLVHRHLDHRVGGELREPADVADDQRLSQREGADRAPGGLAHRRRAERDDRVAGRHQRPELVLGHVRRGARLPPGAPGG